MDHPSPQVVSRLSRSRVLTAFVAVGLLAGCGIGSAPEPPGPGWERGAVPELRGTGVLLLPVQGQAGVAGDVDAELVHALDEAGPTVRWIAGSDLEGAAERAGALGGDPRNLPVAVFEMGEVERVGDPLFGTLYRLAALTDATYAVLPVTARGETADDAGLASVRLNVALLDPRTGRVLWQSIIQGDPGAVDTPAPAALVAERLAGRLLP